MKPMHIAFFKARRYFHHVQRPVVFIQTGSVALRPVGRFGEKKKVRLSQNTSKPSTKIK